MRFNHGRKITVSDVQLLQPYFFDLSLPNYKTVYPFQNNSKDLDPSYKTDLDLWDCFGRKNMAKFTYFQ